MRDSFSEFYSLSEGEFESLWTDGIIVLDTNVLLDLYRTPTDARSQFLSVLEQVKDRIWIPFQVGLEFHRNRPKVISDKAKTISDILAYATKSFGDIKGNIAALDIDKYGLGIESAPLLAELEQVRIKLSEAIGKVHTYQIEISKKDPIQEKLFELYNGKVGAGPKNQDELNGIVKNGEKRYEEKIPPGYEDQIKSKNPNDANFYHNGIKYERRFGDLIFWNQIIDHLKMVKGDKIILVSSEKKEDWWHIENGRKLGPQPELIREIKREAGVVLFWMYPPDQFMKYAAQQSNVDVTEEAITEVRNAGITTVDSSAKSSPNFKSNDYDKNLEDFAFEPIQDGSEQVIFNLTGNIIRWLQDYVDNVMFAGFPDIRVTHKGVNIGFEIVTVRDLKPELLEKQVRNALDMVQLITRSEDYTATYIVIAILPDDYNRIQNSISSTYMTKYVNKTIEEVSRNSNISGIYFGIGSSRRFSPIAFARGLNNHVLESAIPSRFQ